MKYRRTIEVEAFQWHGDPFPEYAPDWFKEWELTGDISYRMTCTEGHIDECEMVVHESHIMRGFVIQRGAYITRDRVKTIADFWEPYSGDRFEAEWTPVLEHPVFARDDNDMQP